MQLTRLVLVTMLLIISPRAAGAQDDGWWSWLERLSGPGPFQGPTTELRLFCVDGAGNIYPCAGDASSAKSPGSPIVHLFTVSIGVLTSGDHPRFADTPADTRSVHIVRVDPTYYFRRNKWLNVGGSIGVMAFSGTGFDTFYRATLTPIVQLTPFAGFKDRWGRVIRLRVAPTYLTKGWNGGDFNSPTAYSSCGEWLLHQWWKLPLDIVFDFSVFRK